MAVETLTPYLLLILTGLGWGIQQLYARARRAERQPTVDWLDLFQTYYRIWAGVHGLEADLALALEARRSRGEVWSSGLRNESRWSHFTASSLYYHALIFRHVDDFTHERGGLWIFSDPSTEDRIADSAVMTGWSSLTLWELSWLSDVLAGVDRSPVRFLLELENSETGRALLDKWRMWIDSCSCSPVFSEDCQVHQVLKACQTYRVLCDEEWDKLAPWYRGTRSGARIDVKKLSLERESVARGRTSDGEHRL